MRLYNCNNCNAKTVLAMDGHICPNCKKPLEDSPLVEEIELRQSTSDQQEQQQEHQSLDTYMPDFRSRPYEKRLKWTFKWKRALSIAVVGAAVAIQLNKEEISSSIAFQDDYTPLLLCILVAVLCFILFGISRRKID